MVGLLHVWVNPVGQGSQFGRLSVFVNPFVSMYGMTRVEFHNIQCVGVSVLATVNYDTICGSCTFVHCTLYTVHTYVSVYYVHTFVHVVLPVSPDVWARYMIRAVVYH